MIYTTLNKIRAHHPCESGWVKLLKHLGKSTPDDEPLALLTILDSNGLDDTLWCLRSVPEHDREWRRAAARADAGAAAWAAAWAAAGAATRADAWAAQEIELRRILS